VAYKAIKHIGEATLYLGNCLEILPTLEGIDAIVTDPPYGGNFDMDSTRFSGGSQEAQARRGKGKFSSPIINDNIPFDPSPFLGYKEILLFGYQFFANKLPPGTIFVWLKRYDEAFQSFLSDAELIWLNRGQGVYCRRDLSMTAEAKHRVHPTQKPVSLMEWCLKYIKGNTICDPFMGSGTTGIAALNLGRKFIGIEIEETYFDIACKRLEEAYRQPSLFEIPKAEQMELL